MLSPIEQLLYGHRGVHGLLSITLTDSRVVIAVAPWDELNAVTEATFAGGELRSVEVFSNDAPEGLSLPWDILGFDCENLGSSRWRFVLHCDRIELCWHSSWPIMTRRNG